MQLLQSAFPVAVFLPLFAGAVAMSIAGMVAHLGNSAVINVLGVILGACLASAATAAFGMLLAAIDPAMFPWDYIANRAVSAVPFAVIGAIGGVSYAYGYGVSHLWKR